MSDDFTGSQDSRRHMTIVSLISGKSEWAHIAHVWAALVTVRDHKLFHSQLRLPCDKQTHVWRSSRLQTTGITNYLHVCYWHNLWGSIFRKRWTIVLIILFCQLTKQTYWSRSNSLGSILMTKLSDIFCGWFWSLSFCFLLFYLDKIEGINCIHVNL